MTSLASAAKNLRQSLQLHFTKMCKLLHLLSKNRKHAVAQALPRFLRISCASRGGKPGRLSQSRRCPERTSSPQDFDIPNLFPYNKMHP
jgi:hypothetical protein